MQPPTFASHHDPHGRCKIHLRVIAVALFIQSHQPKSRLFQLFHRPRQIRHFRHRQMRECPRGRSRHRIRQPRRPPLRNYHAMRTGRQRRSNDRTQIVRILDAIQQNNQSRLTTRSARIRSFNNFFNRSRRTRRHQPDNPLVILRIRQPVNLRPIFKPHRNISRPRQLHNLFHARILPPARNHDAVKRPPRFQRLPHRMYSRQPIHSYSHKKRKLSS